MRISRDPPVNLDEVSEPGDWCYDSRESMLYYLPPGDLFDDTAESAPPVDCLVRMRDTSWITLRGFTLTCTTTGDDYHRQAVEYLLDRGHRSIGFYAPPSAAARSTAPASTGSSLRGTG